MKAMKSQAIAFLLGFALTSFVLFLVPGITKKMSRTNHPSDQKLAALQDSTDVTNVNTSATVVTP